MNRRENRTVTYRVQDGHLVRRTTPGNGGPPYEHRCELATYEAVAHAVEETPAEGQGTTLTKIAQAERLPYSQANVALEFLKERGLVEVPHRRSYPATNSVHLDAMVEFHALAEKGQGPPMQPQQQQL
jgi:hypothetical protein